MYLSSSRPEVGTGARREYAVIGDSVNLAARLMQMAHDGRLLVDRTTIDRVRHHTVHNRLDPVAVKGKSGLVEVWAVHAISERPVAEPADPRTARPMVGRGAEVAGGRELIDRVLAGAGQILCLTGAAGIGKSWLTAEAVEIARQRGFAVFGGASRSHSHGVRGAIAPQFQLRDPPTTRKGSSRSSTQTLETWRVWQPVFVAASE